MNVLSILKITNIIAIFMVTRNLSCIMMMILNLIDRRGGFVEYLLVINHPFSSQNYHIRHCPHNRIEVVLQYCFSRSRTYKYNNMSYHDHGMFYVFIVRVILHMKGAFGFLVMFAIPFKRLGNTSKYHTANKYSSSHPNIIMYQYHYI